MRYRSVITSFLHTCTRVAPHGILRVNISGGNHYLNETGMCNLHKTRHATCYYTHVVIYTWCGYGFYIDSGQKFTRISYLMPIWLHK